MAKLRATGCRVGTQSITIFFSEEIDPANSGAYSIFAPDAGLVNAPFPGAITVAKDNRSILLDSNTPVFSPGQWVMVTLTGVAPSPAEVAAGATGITSEQVSGRAPSDSSPITRDVEDAISYPVLTEEVSYRPSPVGVSASGAGGIAGPGGTNLGQVAFQAVTDVLGWKANAVDPKGFIGALTQAFTLTEVEGHVESKWVPRTYAVQTDLGGGITGAQASLYMRAKDALDQSLSLLDGLYPLDPEADPEYVKALREMARSQMNEIVKEFGVVGLPSILRIDTYFKILLGQDISAHDPPPIRFDPDKIEGTLGKLRDEYAIYFRGNPFNNSIADEQDITNFRVISDYMTSLAQSWVANRDFFRVIPRDQAFFGTQLVLISRQFNVIAETVNEVRFALDSVFIGPNERQALLLKFRDHSLPPMFLEDVLEEVESFATDEGPRLLRDGGKISVTNNILPVVRYLERLVKGAHDPKDPKSVPDGFRTARVRHSLDDLLAQLGDLARLTEQVEQSLPPAEDKLAISGVIGPFNVGDTTFQLGVIGTAFNRKVKATAHSSAPTPAIVSFVGSDRIDVTLPKSLTPGRHDIELENPDGETATLVSAFDWDPQKVAVAIQTKTLAKGVIQADFNPNAQAQLAASGGVPPYTWAVAAGSLPSGLILNSGGVVSGKPLGPAGTSPFTVMVTDSNGSTNSQTFSLSVVDVLSVTTTTLPDATVNQPYSQTIQAAGGVGPYSWAAAGDLPQGITLKPNDGVISGTPAPGSEGLHKFTARATDGNGTATPQGLTINVAGPVAISPPPPSPWHAPLGVYFSQPLHVTGGVAPYTWNLIPGRYGLDGLSVSPEGTISGTPQAVGRYPFTVRVTDSNQSTATQAVTLEVEDEWSKRVDDLEKKVNSIDKKLDQLLARSDKK